MSEAVLTQSAIQGQSEKSPTEFDAIIIGAGMSGMYQLYRLRELGMSVRVFEAGDDVGGTWYWNRYPGARFDSESYSYGYSFSKALLQEWNWSEHFATQPETLRYLNLVADKFDLRRDISFNSRVSAATYDATQNRWLVRLEDGAEASARYLITAVGPLSAPVMPAYEGVKAFRGQSFHTGLWPHHPVDFSGKRVAVIGTGSTGVQVIQEVAKTAGHLTVFQRSPNWCAPLHNRAITEEEQKQIKASYPEIFARCAEAGGNFLHQADPRSALEVTPAERERFYETLYNSPGFGIWLGNFRDILTDQAANDTISDFIARKIRARVKDPKVAEKLIPKDHGFGTRRVPLETNYYEVYNQNNVDLVDLNEEPIQRITESGIQTSAKEYEFDIIVYATGFDAIVGSLNRIDIRGVDGVRLVEKWRSGPKTFLGMLVHGFPNFFMLIGPHNTGTVCNIPRCIEQNVDWVTALLKHMRDKGLVYEDVLEQSEEEWTKHVLDVAAMTLLGKTDSWFTGINKNIAGRDKRTPLMYVGGAPLYRQICDQVSQSGYAALSLH
jgi:cation diffusion facilitator CzcD-associated flavoprotein CzcO